LASNNSQQNGAYRMKWPINACSWSRLQGRIGDDRNSAEIVAGKRVLSCSDVTGIGAAQAEGFEVAYERTIARARLGEVAHAPQVGDQRQHGFDRCRVGVAGLALEGGAFTHRSYLHLHSMPQAAEQLTPKRS